jgi:integrase/recombinase XerD
MEALVQKFVNFLERDKRLSLNTLQSYRRDIEQYFTYLQEINLQNISNSNKTTVIAYLLYLQKKGRATSTISRNLASIRSFYQYISKNKLIDHDPTAELESPKVEKKLPQILSPEEVELLLEQPQCVDLKGYRDKAMLELLYATGIRVSELIQLDLQDLNMDMAYIKCNKGTKERMIPIGSMAISALKENLNKSRSLLIQSADEIALFVNINGSRLTRQGFWKIIKTWPRIMPSAPAALAMICIALSLASLFLPSESEAFSISSKAPFRSASPASMAIASPNTLWFVGTPLL